LKEAGKDPECRWEGGKPLFMNLKGKE